MGGAVSLQQRCRKALVIRAYNSRSADQTLEDQFSAFSYLKGDGQVYTNADLIKQCLNIGPNDYPWLEPFMQVLSGGNQCSATSSPGKTKAFEMKLEDFLLFLETGTLVSYVASDKPPPSVRNTAGSPETPPRRNCSTGDFPNGGTTSLNTKTKQFPPVAPISLDAGGRQSSRSKIVEVLEIDLSSGKIPDGVKIKSENQEVEGNEGKHAENTLEIIIRPVPNSRLASTLPGGAKVVEGNGKQLWRKREIVRQERTVHYTTVDEAGEMQELVEKETTQTEVLHMECRDTGEFAHKETTEYEQVETFNEELVNEVRGHEEYVHLKSLEDEFHYMDSNMPPKGGAGGDGGGSSDPEKEAESRGRRPSGHEETDPRSPHDEYDTHNDHSSSCRDREAATGSANASYIFEPSDDKNRPNDWSPEEEEAYKQYCADFKQGEFRFADTNSQDPESNNDYLKATIPIVTHSDDNTEDYREAPAVTIPPISGVAPTTQDSCDTGGYAVVSSENMDEDLSPVKRAYTSMHDID